MEHIFLVKSNMIQWILLSVSVILFAAVSVSSDVICLGHCSKQCTCSQNYTFQCDEGTCVSLDKYRNHIKDCPDGTDEAFQCCPNQFLCDRKGGIGKCLPFELLDNNVTDCLDQTDETLNNERSCEVLEDRSIKEKVPNQSYYYTCQTVPNGSQVGKCIAMQLVLDGKEDCPMSDDEEPANFDECVLKKSNCSINASCVNIPNGAFKCTCLKGFPGDGVNCAKA